MAQPHGFSHDHGQKFQFHDGGISASRLAGFLLVACAPVNIFECIAQVMTRGE